jgi:hypothetical protein
LLAKQRRRSSQPRGRLSRRRIKAADDTLWHGTFAEGDDVNIMPHRAEMIRAAKQRGVINSIVSKNDPKVARAKLEEFGLWGDLIAPRISMLPKGELVKTQIEALQLRETNVLFVDDNPLNLNEVEFYCPKIKTMDARLEETDAAILKIIDKSPLDGGKRHRSYEVLSRKISEESAFEGGNEDFLRSSGVKIAMAFSCRVMNMKVENVVMGMIVRNHGPRDCVVQPESPNYISIVPANSAEFAPDMYAASSGQAKGIMVMANCQSGIIAHYMRMPERTDAEQQPHIFNLLAADSKAPPYAEKFDFLVYGIFVDHSPAYWGPHFSLGNFRSRLDVALDAWSGVKKVVILLPPNSQQIFGEGPEEKVTFAQINEIVVASCGDRSNVEIVRLGEFVEEPNEVTDDLRHFSRPLFKRVAEHVSQGLAA